MRDHHLMLPAKSFCGGGKQFVSSVCSMQWDKLHLENMMGCYILNV